MRIQSTLSFFRSKGWVSWPLICFAWILLTVLFSGDTSLVDGDTYMHIGIGHWILDHGQIPRVDYFSHTMAGQPWVAHEWLSEVVLAVLQQTTGWSGLVMVAGLCTAFAVAYMLRFMLDREVVPLYAIAFAVLGFMALKTHLLVRPHVLTWPIIVLWTAGLLQASESGRRPALWLALLLVPWVNLHGGFVLAFPLLGLIALDALSKAHRDQRHAVLYGWGSFTLISLLMTLINPFGYKAWLFIVDLMDNSYLKHVSEWQAVNFAEYGSIEIWLYSLLALGLMGMLRLPVWRMLLLLCLVYEALSHVRYVSIFGLVTPLLIAAPFAVSYAQWAVARGGAAPHAMDRFFERWCQPASGLSWAALILAGIGLAMLNSVYARNQPEQSTMPQAAVDAALAGRVMGKVFNHDGGGGYLIMRGISAYTDGRADLYGAEFMSQINRLLRSDNLQEIQEQMDSAKIGWVLLPASSVLIQTLKSSPDWLLLHEAEGVSVLKRKK